MTDRPVPDPYNANCPSRYVIEVIASKWSLLLLPALMDGPKRNGQLMRQIQGISQKMLTQTLKALEEYNLVQRYDYQEVPPKVEYTLTEQGRSLVGIIADLDQWVIDHFYELKK
ncbi:winged helix-turn-helix transcriptional regulator [Curvivirga sp.]|uniref:winged helix-turn-helix transcriptional regulator n=1 Tax=Curvivirga sp. TaxID=2856848 RepID=UPI003B5C2D7C